MADTTTDTDSETDASAAGRPWVALGALCVGFFMILVDVTIVAVAIPSIKNALGTDVNATIWVSSVYLLTYAVPLLITGRLGDRFGPKRLYQAGLVVFTLSSLWCGFTGTIAMLITARAVQGIGAALMTPQTMAVITRIFPAYTRGKALGIWSTVAGVATLSGPIFGGLLIDSLGWEWIFFVNVPVGVVAFVLAWRYVPSFPTHSHRFDIVGVVLSAAGMFLLVFGIQQGQTLGWDTGVWTMIVAGLVVLAGFVSWQRRTSSEPLLPLTLFRDRNFSLANVAITTVGFAVTALGFPFMLYAQSVLGLSPLRAALLMVPVAGLSGILAPFVGRLADRAHPRNLAGFGLACFCGGLVWLSAVMHPDTALGTLLAPLTMLGVGQGFVWSPLTTTATRNLPMAQAGAGSGVYNTTRQVGSVLGSAGIAVLMQARIGAELPGLSGHTSTAGDTSQLPAAIREGFASAMGQSLLLPAAALALGLLAALCFELPAQLRRTTPSGNGGRTVTAAGDNITEPQG